MTGISNRLLIKALDGRSECFRWLWKSHAEVAAFLATNPQSAWATLARTYAEESGATMTREAMRQAWRRVEEEWARAPVEVRDAYSADKQRAGVSPSASNFSPNPVSQPVTQNKETHDVRPGTFTFNASPKENDKDRLFGKRGEDE